MGLTRAHCNHYYHYYLSMEARYRVVVHLLHTRDCIIFVIRFLCPSSGPLDQGSSASFKCAPKIVSPQMRSYLPVYPEPFFSLGLISFALLRVSRLTSSTSSFFDCLEAPNDATISEQPKEEWSASQASPLLANRPSGPLGVGSEMRATVAESIEFETDSVPSPSLHRGPQQSLQPALESLAVCAQRHRVGTCRASARTGSIVTE